MESKKKFTITIAVLVVALIASITTMIIVLVTANQNATSAVNVKYTAEEVYVRLSAKAYVGSSTYTFKNGSSTTLDLSPANSTGEMSQTEAEIALSKENDTIVFEYKFENLTSDIDASIDLELALTQENVELGYAYSSVTPLTDLSSISTDSAYSQQLLGAYTDEAKRVQYVYIVAKIDDYLFNASLTGNFNWSLGRTEAVVVNINRSEATMAEEGEGQKYFASTKIYEPQWENIENKRFNGWYTSDTIQDDTTRIQFPITLTNDINMYPAYQDGNVPSDYYFLNEDGTGYKIIYYSNNYDDDYNLIQQTALPSSTLIIPDVYNGINGIKKVTEVVAEGYGAEPELYGFNSRVIYIGNYVESARYIGVSDLYKAMPYSSQTTFVEVGRNTKTLYDCFLDCPNLATVRLSDSIIGLSASYSDGTEEDYGGYWAEWDMLYNSGLVGSPVYNNNSVLTAYNNSEYDILIKIEDGITSTSQITNWDSIECVGGYLFSTFIPTDLSGNSSSYGLWSSTLTTAVIPTSMTEVSSSLFGGCSNLSSVALHNGVTSIGDYAFEDCSGLTSITIPSSVTSIGEYAFEGCSSLTSITIPSSVTSIGHNAFNGCSGLTSITIPSGVTSIGHNAFNGCSGLTSITIPSGVTSIEYGTFYGCRGLTSITIPSGVTYIGELTFYNCSGLTSITIPSGVTSIGGDAFTGCSNLTSITIPSSVTSIGTFAFSYCTNLTSITIPSSVTSIGYYAFYGCTGLLASNGGSGITFNSPSGWTKASDSSFTSNVTSGISLTDPAQNATWLVSTGGYCNCYLKRV